jgi:hypothetical protein
MAIKEHTPLKTLDLDGPDGNVFSLMGIVNRNAKALELDGKAIIKEMKSGDYRNAVYVFNRDFGEFFDIVLPKGMTIQSLKDSYMKTNMNEQKMEEVYTK